MATRSNTERCVEAKGFWPLRARNVLLGSVIFFAAGVACTAGTPPDRVNHDGGIVYPEEEIPETELICSEQTPIAAPMVTGLPATASQLSQPIRGTAVGASLVTARSAAGTSAPARVSVNGNFCIDVQLMPNQPNQITLTSISAGGCSGAETQINLTHVEPQPIDVPEQQQPAQSTGPTNLAINASIDAYANPDQGSDIRNLVDGNTATAVRFSKFDPDWSDVADAGFWVRIDLGKLNAIHGARIHWDAAGGQECATSFALLLSPQLIPGEPDKDNADWVLATERNGMPCGGSVDVAFDPAQARWAALVLYEDANHAWWGNGPLGQYEYFRVAEIEILGQNPDLPSPIQNGYTDTCR